MKTVSQIFSHRSNIYKLAVGSKGAIGLDLDWVTPTELEVNGLVIKPTGDTIGNCGINPSVSRKIKDKWVKTRIKIACDFVAWNSFSCRRTSQSCPTGSCQDRRFVLICTPVQKS